MPREQPAKLYCQPVVILSVGLDHVRRQSRSGQTELDEGSADKRGFVCGRRVPRGLGRRELGIEILGEPDLVISACWTGLGLSGTADVYNRVDEGDMKRT